MQAFFVHSMVNFTQIPFANERMLLPTEAPVQSGLPSIGYLAGTHPGVL
jgi:hypothetical protein